MELAAPAWSIFYVEDKITMPREFNSDSFYTFLTEGKFMGTQCNQCSQLSVEPRMLCPNCHSKDIQWYEFSGTGHLSTFTCISIVPARMEQQGYGRNNPYCSGVVTLTEGPRISARLSKVDASNPETIKSGMSLKIDFDNIDTNNPMLTFCPD